MKTLKLFMGVMIMLTYTAVYQAKGQWAASGNDIYNTNTGNVGIGTASPGTLFYVAKDMTEPTVTVRNLGSAGGATYSMIDDASGADWKFKATQNGGFKIRDHNAGLNVFVIEPNSSDNALFIGGSGNIGIGTGSPVSKLHVEGGDARINGLTIGKGAGAELSNTAVGYIALQLNSTGFANTAIGRAALTQNTFGFRNTALGSNALAGNLTGNDNTACGNQALFFNTEGDGNTAIGSGSLMNNDTGIFNTACGYSSMSSNQSGSGNTAIGGIALSNNSIGWSNTAIGYAALNLNDTGSFNTAVGENALSSANNNQLTGLGRIANVSSADISNSTVIGDGAIVNASFKVRIGDATMTVIEGQVDWSYPSDGRFKLNVREEVKGLDFIKLLRPVVYNFDTRKYTEFLTQDMPGELKNKYLNSKDFSESTAIRRSGFVAQEVADAANASGYDFNGVHVPVSERDNYSIAYSQFVVPLVKAVQEQQIIIEEQQRQIDELMLRVSELED